MVKGGYEQMPDVYGAVIAWVNENGYEYDGSMFTTNRSQRSPEKKAYLNRLSAIGGTRPKKMAMLLPVMMLYQTSGAHLINFLSLLRLPVLTKALPDWAG